MSVEAFVLTNFMMNAAIFAVSARLTGHIRWARVIAGAAFGCGYAVAAFQFRESSWLNGFPAQTIFMGILTWIVFGGRSRRRNLVGFAALLVSVFFIGGIMTFLKKWIPSGGFLLTLTGWPTIVVSIVLLDVLRDETEEIRGQVYLKISTKMGSREVCALVDTGNRLHEPLSGLPVMIVGRRLLKGLLDASCMENPARRLLPGFRLIRYGALGGGGIMQCFKPTSVCVKLKNRWVEAPDMWVAIYPGELPSGVEAVAPPVFKG